MVLGLLVAGLLLTGCGGGSGGGSGGVSRAGPSAPGHRSTPLLSIFQADVPLHADPAGTLDVLRRLGADTVRVFMPWGSLGRLGAMAPDPLSATRPTAFDGANPGAYPAANWQVYDTIIRDAQARDMSVDLTLGPPPPLWARGAGDPGHPPHPQWRPSVAEFTAFVRAVGIRYSGQYTPSGDTTPLPHVAFWAIWNEPNFGPMIAPQSIGGADVSPSLYRSMVDGAWSALRATDHGGDTILIGELAPFGRATGPGPGEFGYMVPLRFLRSLYCVDASLRPLRGSAATRVGCPGDDTGVRGFRAAHPGLFAASGFALHPYSQGPPAVAVPGEPDYANLPAIPNVEHTLDKIMSAYGSDKRFAIYSTEFGVHTNPPETVFGTVSPAVAAQDLNQSEYITWRDPRLRSYDQYLLRDPPAGNFATGLEYANGQPKPGLAAYRLPLYLPVTSFRRGQRLEVWGCARPSRYARVSPRSRRVEIQFRTAGEGGFRTVEVVKLDGRSVYFDVLHGFTASGTVRLVWHPPAGPAIYSRTVNISSR